MSALSSETWSAMKYFNPQEILNSLKESSHRLFDSLRFLWLRTRFGRRFRSLSPVFIVGPGHSGTSIMLRIVGNHEAFLAIPNESRLFYRTNEEILHTISAWEAKRIQTGSRRWIEKTPEHIYVAGRILKLFPNCKMICMMRDGREVACSLRRRVGSLERGIRIWLRSFRSIRRHLGDSRVLMVKLEELTANPRETLTRIFDFLGEEFDPGILEYHKRPAYFYSDKIERPESEIDGAEHLNLRNWQINQPLYKPDKKWTSEMDDDDVCLFKKMAQNELESLGYENNPDW
jgi:hypothetical protein